MSRLTALVPLAIVVLAVSGCGTIGNLYDRDKIYGGICLDGKEALRASKDLLHRPEVPDYTVEQDSAILVLASVDMPLSVLADTLTLPITVPKTVYHWLKGDSPPDGAKDRLQVVSQPTPSVGEGSLSPLAGARSQSHRIDEPRP